jgi:hypothetical protein
MEEFVKGDVFVIPFSGLPSIKFNSIYFTTFLSRVKKHMPLSIWRGARKSFDQHTLAWGEVNRIVSLLDQSL